MEDHTAPILGNDNPSPAKGYIQSPVAKMEGCYDQSLRSKGMMKDEPFFTNEF